MDNLSPLKLRGRPEEGRSFDYRIRAIGQMPVGGLLVHGRLGDRNSARLNRPAGERKGSSPNLLADRNARGNRLMPVGWGDTFKQTGQGVALTQDGSNDKRS